jgi:glycosyltransferase involved in cell wall biosynthesis
MNPTISVIMPIRGPAPYLVAALDSILRQSISVHELLVIDDGIEPQVLVILKEAATRGLSYRILKGPKQGPAAARNIGLRAAAGEWIAFLDDDDVWPDDKLTQQGAYLTNHPEIEMVSGKIGWFHAWGSNHLPIPSEQDNIIVHVNLGAHLLRRTLLERVGFLDETLMFSEDVDWILRLIDEDHPFAILPLVTLWYRRHPSSMTAQKLERETLDYRKVLFASLRRRRHRQPVKLECYLVEQS